MRPGEPDPLRAERGDRGPRETWRRAPELFDAGLRGGEDVDLGVAPGRGRMGRPLRAGRAPSNTTGRRRWGLPRAPRLLRDDGGAPGPTPQGRAGTRPRLGVVAGRVGTGAGAATGAGAGGAGGVHRRPGPPARGPRARSRSRWRRGSPAAARRAAALPSLAGLARAWSPACVLGLAFRRTRQGVGTGAARPGAAATGCDDRAVHWTRCATPRSTSPTTPPTASASGPGARESARSYRWCRGSRGDPALVGPVASRRAGPREGGGGEATSDAAGSSPSKAKLAVLVLPVRRIPERPARPLGPDDDRVQPAPRTRRAGAPRPRPAAARRGPWRRCAGATASR